VPHERQRSPVTEVLIQKKFSKVECISTNSNACPFLEV
jgi:hypothetical protein